MKWQTMSGEPLHLIIWGLICHKVKGIWVFYGHSPKDFISLQLRISFFKDGGWGALGNGLSGLWVQPALSGGMCQRRWSGSNSAIKIQK
jgi:hypothetical protein